MTGKNDLQMKAGTELLDYLNDRSQDEDIRGQFKRDPDQVSVPSPATCSLLRSIATFAGHFGFFSDRSKTEMDEALVSAWDDRPAWVPKDSDQQQLIGGLLALACAEQPWTTLPAGPSSMLTMGGAPVRALVKAGRPTIVQVRAPADLRYRRAVLRLTGRTLLRDLTAADNDGLCWGGDRSGEGGDCALSLRQPTRIASVMLRDARLADFIDRDRSAYNPLKALWRAVFAACMIYGFRRHTISITLGQPGATVALSASDFATASLNEMIPVGVDTNAVALTATSPGNASQLSWHVLSPSAARTVAVGVGDDTPQQVLGAELADGVGVATRDLAAAFQSAWNRAKPAAGMVTIPISLLSAQDGLLDVALDGLCERYAPIAEEAVTLAPHSPYLLSVPPLAGVPGATVTLRSRGASAGGVVANLVSPTGGSRCAVLVDERLHIAQALRLRDPSATPGNATGIVAVWLCLESLPAVAAQLRLTLAPTADSTFAPGQSLGARAVSLPVDCAAYQQREGESCWWFRVAWEPGLALDGVQAGQPLLLMASGDANGLRLMHAQAAGVAPVPAGRGAGCAHYRHLDRDRSWRPRDLFGAAVQWLMDVELGPLDDEQVVTVDGIPLHRGGGRWPDTTWTGTTTAGRLTLISATAATLELTGDVVAPA